MANCSDCNYSCPRGSHSLYGISADCDLVCTYEEKEMYVNARKVCKHFTVKGTRVNWNEKRKRIYPVEKIDTIG